MGMMRVAQRREDIVFRSSYTAGGSPSLIRIVLDHCPNSKTCPAI